MKTILSLVLLGSALLTAAVAAPPTADEVMADAGRKAMSEKKAVYLHFGASWCGWCKRHDAFLEQAAIKPVFEKYFVPVKLIVQETEKNKSLENAGAEAWLKKVGGPSGLPFSAFLDAKGSLLVNSKATSGGNIGHPIDPAEIDWFIAMMKKAAPRMTAEDIKTIESALRAQKK